MKLGEAQRLDKNACLSCGKGLDACSQVDREEELGRSPKPGDITVCLYCGHIMAFAGDLSYRQLTGEEMDYIAGDARMISLKKTREDVGRC